MITDKAIGWLEQRDKDRPFAMLYYHKAPHRNWMPAQRHLGIYDDKVFPEPETLLDAMRPAAAPPASRRWRSAATCGPSGT